MDFVFLNNLLRGAYTYGQTYSYMNKQKHTQRCFWSCWSLCQLPQASGFLEKDQNMNNNKRINKYSSHIHCILLIQICFVFLCPLFVVFVLQETVETQSVRHRVKEGCLTSLIYCSHTLQASRLLLRSRKFHCFVIGLLN